VLVVAEALHPCVRRPKQVAKKGGCTIGAQT